MSHTRTVFDVHQDMSGKYSARLVDENNAAIDITVVESLELTLYDSTTDEIINNREDQNVLNLNGVTLDCDGTLTWLWEALDMPRLHTTKAAETHIALFRVVWGSGVKQLLHDVAFRVNKVNIP